VRDADKLAVPLGPGQPVTFLHALGARERFERLDVFAALLVDAFALFTRPGVTLLSGFYGPVERALRDAGHAVRFVPADFRRFARIAKQMAPRVMATAATPARSRRLLLARAARGRDRRRALRCGRDPAAC
jgi:hypothetical protein